MSVFEEFKSITNFDIELFIDNYISFIDNEFIDIDSFFSGRKNDLDKNALNLFNKLKSDCNVILSLFVIHKTSFKSASYWMLLELIENINERFDSIDNLSKWYRTNFSVTSYSNTISKNFILKQNQTIEDIVLELNGNESDYYKISRNNNALEEIIVDGKTITVQLRKQANTQIESVIDSLVNESIYGLDLNRNIEFIDNDLVSLEHKATIHQLVEILFGLKINDNPDHPTDGVNPKLLVGATFKSGGYPIILRQLYSTFNQEDSIKSISLTKLQELEDSVFMEFNIETHLNEFIQETLTL